MNVKYLAASLFLLPCFAAAETPLETVPLSYSAPVQPQVKPPQSAREAYYDNANPKLTQQEKDAIAIANRWRADSATGVKPVQGTDGSIKFLFGSSQISIVCAVLQVCDVELQPGENVNNLNLGDTSRWSVEPAVSGSGATEVTHLIIKPLDVGLDTTLILTTNRRTYNFRLKSHRTEFMPRISFTYPEDAMAKWEALKQKQEEQKKEATIPETGEYLGNLDFNYSIVGNVSWKPVRVYNNGTKTIIQMPREMQQNEAPTLLVIRGDDQQVMVNYRLQGDRYIVDSLFDKATLIIGVGSSQEQVEITRDKANSTASSFNDNKYGG